MTHDGWRKQARAGFGDKRQIDERCVKRESGVANVRSQCMWMVVPMPIARPSTPETTGFLVLASAPGNRTPRCPSTAHGDGHEILHVVAGGERAGGAEHHMHAHAFIALALDQRPAIAEYMARVMAFFFSGRLKRMRLMAPVSPARSMRM
jgi:hypothetical protein